MASYKAKIARMQALLDAHGICGKCGELYEHTECEPFALCKCGCSEWHQLTPHMQLVQKLHAEIAELQRWKEEQLRDWKRAVSEFLVSHDAAWAELFKSLPADTQSVTVSNHQADAVRKANVLRAMLQASELHTANANAKVYAVTEPDRHFLRWIHARLQHVHGEDPLYDYMHKLRAVIAATPATQRTPNVCSYNNLDEVPS